MGEPLRAHPKRKRCKSRSKFSNDRSTDEERSPSPKRRSKKSKKRHRSRSKKNKKKKHWRYSSLPSPSSSSNDDSDESKYRNIEGKESTDSRFRVISEEDQYKYSLPPDMAHYASVNFDTYIKEADPIKAVLIKNPVLENINPVKTLNDFVKDILKDKKKQKDVDFDNFFEKIQGQNRSVMGPLSKIWTVAESARLSQEHSVEIDVSEIQEFVEKTVLLLGQALNSIFYYTEDFTCCWD